MSEQKNYSKIVSILSIVFIALALITFVTAIIFLLALINAIDLGSEDEYMPIFCPTLGVLSILGGVIPILQGVYYLKKHISVGKVANKTLSIVLLVFGSILALAGILMILSWYPIDKDDFSGSIDLALFVILIILVVFESLIIKWTKTKKVAAQPSTNA